jgi:hypothetical protein
MNSNTTFSLHDDRPECYSAGTEIDPQHVAVMTLIRDIRRALPVPAQYLPPPPKTGPADWSPGTRCPACYVLMFRDDCDRSSHGNWCDCKDGFWYCPSERCPVGCRSLNLAPWEASPVGRLERMFRRSRESGMRLASPSYWDEA